MSHTAFNVRLEEPQIQIPQNLLLAESFFLDHRLVSKAYINNLSRSELEIMPLLRQNMFAVSTCLRFELMNFSGNPWPQFNADKFALAHGVLCLKRFISLLSGLQSEIVGEGEIFLQMRAAVSQAAQSGRLDKNTFWQINKLFYFAQSVRTLFNLTRKENYATVGANLLSKKIQKPADVAIVGGGYMSQSFLDALDASTVTSIFWINRNVKKVKTFVNSQKKFPSSVFHFVPLEQATKILPRVDFVFAAARNCGGLFSDLQLPNAECVVDVSYPSLFSNNVTTKFYGLNNTFFEKLIENPVSKEVVIQAHEYIDKAFRAYE